jgi:cell division protease FtsH
MGDRAPRPGPVDYVNVPVALGRVRACVQHGLYLLRDGEAPLAALLRGPSEHGGMPRIQIEVMAPGPEAAAGFLAEIREGMLRHNVYRGQLLALGNPHGPFGEGGAMVEFLTMPEIERNEVILPGGVLERVERHTVRFTEHADELLAVGRHLKRGLLLHGPPGTGKTLTAMYLVGRMPGRTTLVLSGRSYGLVSPTCELARNLQPSMVILEDVDLVAEERGAGFMGENPLLFELLNEMDGMAEDADVIFVLTTNRPDLLEHALAARPGRVDQATEIPLPDAECRRRLISLYGEGLDLRLEAVEEVVARTEGTSASFIKELLRRATLFAAEQDGDLIVTDRHVCDALEELLVAGGTLTARLLGGEPPGAPSPRWFEDAGSEPPDGNPE